MDFTKYMRNILNIDPQKRLATVQPGCVLDKLQLALRPHKLIFGPDPATHNHCAIGGMLGNNSCGIHSLIGADNGFGLRTSDNVHELEVLTYDGEVMRVGPTPPDELYRTIGEGGSKGQIYEKLKNLIGKYGEAIRRDYPKLPRRVSGYNLDDLLPENNFHVARSLVGSECTLVTILEATLHLMPDYPAALAARAWVSRRLLPPVTTSWRSSSTSPSAWRGWITSSSSSTRPRANMPMPCIFCLKAGAFSSSNSADRPRKKPMRSSSNAWPSSKALPNGPNVKWYDDEQHEEKLWQVRESGLGSTAWVPNEPDTWPGWEDSAVKPEVIGPYLRELKELFRKHDYRVATYGHFGQGVVHCRIPFDFYTRQGIDDYKIFMEEATDLVVKYRGAFSGEHGDGQARARYLPKMFGQTCMQAMRDFKSIWDPHGKMNPGKVIDPYSNIENMRIGPDYNPPEPETHFEYPHDMHLFSRAALRCVGVGKCRREGDQTMCPSYMVTQEEKYSTRGRARLLFEMLNGEILRDGWKSDEVHEALHLCLACKGCKGDCPVSVDMATYKAEFFSHYYQGRLRPRHMFAFGLIHVWSRLASVAPTIANFFTQTPGIDVLAKWFAGVDQRRKQIPAFAPRTFKNWFAQHQARHPKGPPVLLFADTFHNYFHPDVAQAAVEVLEDAEFHVMVMEQDMCCGRPLYDYGFLNIARRWLEDIIEKMRPHIEAGIPMVVLEPSCWATFYDELTNLLSGNKDADRLHKNTFPLGAFLKENAPHYKPPRLHRKAILHRHCHHKSELKHEPNYEEQILKEMGMEVQEPETGCCGMAGAFGYTAGEEYEVSIACGERVLLPKVRESKDQTIIVADGFSCREQISQETDRHALHLAQVIQLAKRYGPYGPDGQPEKPFIRERNDQHRQARKRVLTTAAVVGAGFVAGSVLYGSLKHRPAKRSKVSRAAHRVRRLISR